MATGAEIANLKSCAISNRKGTGIKHCSFNEKVIRKNFFSKRGFDYATIDFDDQSELTVEIQKGNVIPLPKMYNFERLTEENVIETSQLGLGSLARKGIYKYRLTFDRDDRLQSVFTSLDSNDVFDYVSIDSAGNMKLVENGSQNNGASVGLLDTDPFTEADGAVSSKVSMMVELNDPEDYNSNAVYYARENIGFNPLKVEGINDIDLTMTAFASGATQISFTAFLKDGDTAFSVGTDTDFRLTINDTVETITGNVTNDGATYTITGLTALVANDVIKLSTYDSTTSTVAIIKDTVDVYSGKEITVTVA